MVAHRKAIQPPPERPLAAAGSTQQLGRLTAPCCPALPAVLACTPNETEGKEASSSGQQLSCFTGLPFLPRHPRHSQATSPRGCSSCTSGNGPCPCARHPRRRARPLLCASSRRSSSTGSRSSSSIAIATFALLHHHHLPFHQGPLPLLLSPSPSLPASLTLTELPLPPP